MTRVLVFYIFLFVAFFSCSKEEIIPFIVEDKDTLRPTSYSDLSGTYIGNLYNIDIVNDSINILSSESHTVTIDQIEINSIMINNITNLENVNAEAIISREIGAVYLKMDDTKLPENLGTISAFYVDGTAYNGIYYFQNPKEVQYFIYITDMVDTVQQMFNGKLIQ